MMLLPTHTCFDDAIETLGEMFTASHNDYADLRLVHGLVRLPNGKLSAHAWCEFEKNAKTYVVFVAILNGERQHFVGEQGEYYAEIGVVETTRYTVEQAALENRRSGNLGPWLPRYRARTRDAKRAR